MSTRSVDAAATARLAIALGARLLTVSQRVVVAADADDWVLVEAGLTERAPLTRALAALDPDRLDAITRASLRAAVADALALDRRVLAAVQARQAALLREMQTSRKGRRVLGAYVLSADESTAGVLNQSG